MIKNTRKKRYSQLASVSYNNVKNFIRCDEKKYILKYFVYIVYSILIYFLHFIIFMKN